MAKTIGREQARVIVEMARDAARKVLEKEGLTVSTVGGSRFDATQVTFKLQAMVADTVEDNHDRDCGLLGLGENIVGKTFKIRRTVHTVTGISLRRPKYPISTTTQNGARYKFTVEQVAMYLGVKLGNRRVLR